jgi:hypothetical protein
MSDVSTEMINLANKLDLAGLKKEANKIDSLLRVISSQDDLEQLGPDDSYIVAEKYSSSPDEPKIAKSVLINTFKKMVDTFFGCDCTIEDYSWGPSFYTTINGEKEYDEDRYWWHIDYCQDGQDNCDNFQAWLVYKGHGYENMVETKDGEKLYIYGEF